jgi:hypothetical protein
LLNSFFYFCTAYAVWFTVQNRSNALVQTTGYRYTGGMIAIQKTVTIPENRRISVDLPEYFPAGTATLLFALVDTERVPSFEGAFPSIEELKRQAAEKTARRKAEGRKPFDNLCGVLKDSPALSGDPVEMVRAWRDEWETAR